MNTKIMKYILTSVLFFGMIPGTHGEEEFQGVALPKFDITASQSQKTDSSLSQEPNDKAALAEVELLRMVSPNGNEVVYSLSSQVMGRALNTRDYTIPGIGLQVSNSRLCQLTVSDAEELRRAEMKLELEIVIEELKGQEKPRFLSETQQDILAAVPACEVFKLQLTAISKMIQGYDYSELAMTTVR